MADFFDALGETLLDVGKSIGNAYANTLGNSSAALETTTAADDSDKITIGGVTVTPLGIIMTRLFQKMNLLRCKIRSPNAQGIDGRL